jgi:colanic acid/amylovoran biosynthesis glycosyltransferase
MTSSQRRGGPVAIVCSQMPSVSETLIKAHLDRVADRIVVSGWRPAVAGRRVMSWPRLAAHKALRMVTREGLERQTTAAYVSAFARHRVSAVLAEYGPTAVAVLPACQRLGIPLIAHFHGYDASNYGTLEKYRSAYRELFREAAAIVAVSRAMQQKLTEMGAPAEKVHYNPCGVDCSRFQGAFPATAPPVLVGVGRFTEKKAPHLTILAFAAALRHCPDARLRLIGDGPLLDACHDLAQALRIQNAVSFLGVRDPGAVMEEMRRARAFVQHSLKAPSGDCEGTPVTIVEAGAAGLPVVSTRHGGIPDVVLEGETGFLVAEHDVEGMAARMVDVLTQPQLAGRLGRAARHRIENCFSIERSIDRLDTIIGECISAAPRHDRRGIMRTVAGEAL